MKHISIQIVFLSAAFFVGLFCLSVSGAADISSRVEQEAFSVEPMEMKFSVGVGAGAARTPLASKFRLRNQSETSTRIRIDVFERTNDLDGSERRKPTKNWKLSDAEFELPGGTEKSIEISYRGSRRLKAERAYRVVIKQVDADRAVETGSSLDLRFVYVASVYVVPEKASPKLSVERVRRVDEKSFEVEIFNKGTAHKKMGDANLVIRQKSSTGLRAVKLSENSRRQLSRLNILASGRLRTILEVAPGDELIDGTVIDVGF